MGAAATLLSYRDPNVVFIDDPKDVSPLLKGFAKSLFRKMEWPTLKIFCNTYGITHGDTCVVFKRFLQYEEVYLLQFKVRTKDVRNHFNMHSRLEKVCYVCLTYLSNLTHPCVNNRIRTIV
jgi:hypothetical protein